jgi:TPR repeat protein
VNGIAARLRPARQLAIGLLLAGACAAVTRAETGTESGVKPAAAESRLRLAQNLAHAKTERNTAPRGDAAKEKSGPSRNGKRNGARFKSNAADAAKMRALMQLSGTQIEQRVAAQRALLRQDPKDEAARQTLGLIAVELGNRILDLDALGRKHELAHWMDVIQEDLHDTLWRVSQLAKTHGRASAALGLFYSEGILAGHEPGKGCEHYARAAQSGHVAAAFYAGLCKTVTDPALAQTLLEHAAEKGHAGAEEVMGRGCIEGERKDSACARDWLERAAANGRPSAMSLLAWLYANDAERLDLAKSVYFYRAAADAGDATAQNNLGEFYETGRAVPQDAAQSFSWYARAAETGFPPAQLNLARLYAAGTGVERNLATARTWAERAQKQGLGQAQALLDWLAKQR